MFEKARRDGTTLVLAGVHTQPLGVMTQSGFAARVGTQNMTASLDDALVRARTLLEARDAG